MHGSIIEPNTGAYMEGENHPWQTFVIDIDERGEAVTVDLIEVIGGISCDDCKDTHWIGTLYDIDHGIVVAQRGLEDVEVPNGDPGWIEGTRIAENVKGEEA